MSLRDVLGQIGRFVTGIVPSVMKLSEALTLLLGVLSVKVASKDLPALREAAELGQELGALFCDLGNELIEFFVLLAKSAEDGKLDGTEIKLLLNEGDDIIPIVTQLSARAAALTVKIRSLF